MMIALLAYIKGPDPTPFADFGRVSVIKGFTRNEGLLEAHIHCHYYIHRSFGAKA